MFRDLKEYQQIQSIYEEISCISDEERILTESLIAQEFTEEEFACLVENIDEISALIAEELCDEYQTLSEEVLTEEDLLDIQEGIGSFIKRGVTAVGKRLNPTFKRGVKDVFKGGKEALKSTFKKAKTAVGDTLRAAAPIAKNVLKTTGKVALAATPIGGLVYGLNALRKRGKEARLKQEAEKNKTKTDNTTKTDTTTKTETKPNIYNDKGGLTFSQAIKGGEKLNQSLNQSKTDTKTNKPEGSGKEIPKPREIGKEKGQINPNSSRGRAIERNVDKFGEKRVNYLRNQNAAFQASKNKNSGYTRADFIKDFPDSNAAKEAKKRNRRPNVMDYESFNPSYDHKTANNLAEIYKNMYNIPSEESEKKNLDEGVKKEIVKGVAKGVKKTAEKAGKLIRQGVRKKGALPGGPQKPKKGFYNVKAGPNSEIDYSATGFKKVRPEGGGSRRVKATYGKKPEKSFMQSQKDKLEAQRQGVSVKELDSARAAENAKIKDAVARERAPRTGVDPTRGKKATKRKSFQDKNFKPKYESYEPYDVVLEYLLQSEMASTIEEANNIIIEMDNQTIEEIITERKYGPGPNSNPPSGRSVGGTATGPKEQKPGSRVPRGPRTKPQEPKPGSRGPRTGKPSGGTKAAGASGPKSGSRAGGKGAPTGGTAVGGAASGPMNEEPTLIQQVKVKQPGVTLDGGKTYFDPRTGNPIKMPKKKKPSMKEGYDAYDLVLEYLLSTEQAATIEEANYIMTEMDAETIQGIVTEGLGSAIKKVGKTVGGAVRKGMKKVKGSEMTGDFPVKGGKAYSA